MRRNFARGFRPVINSVKNVVDITASTGTTQTNNAIVVAQDTATTAVQVDVQKGCLIKAIWCSFDVCGLAATGVLQRTAVYLMKNQGNNITPPNGFTVGTSNEKKLVIRQWQFMTMRNQDGNPPNHWEGWIKIPKRFQRMGTDDRWNLPVVTTTAAGHFSAQVIYKWYT